MHRILVIGCPGSGKSTLARRLGASTGLPVIHLDAIHWKAGWKEPEHADWLKTLDEALAGEAWIVDGNYTRDLERRLRAAEAVILLQLPRRVCLWRTLRRVILGMGETRADMAPGCPERIDLGFLHFIWNFERLQLPVIEGLLKNFPGRVIVLRSTRQVREFAEVHAASL